MKFAKPKYAVLDRRHPMSKGLFNYWLVNEEGGTSIYDIGSGRITGTLINPTNRESGKFGKALNFVSASSRSVTVGAANAYTITNTTFCFVFWFRGTSTGIQYMFSNQGVGITGGYGVGMNITAGSAGRIGTVIKNTGATSSCILRESTKAYNDGLWHCAAINVTCDGSTSGNNNTEIYVDGVLDQGAITRSGTSNGSSGTTASWGARPSGNYYDGQMENMRIYKRSLSAQEAAWLYREPFVGIANPFNLNFALDSPSGGVATTNLQYSFVTG